MLKHVKKLGRRLLSPGAVVVDILDDNPADFRKKHPEMYQAVFGEGKPASHPLGLHLNMFAQSIKMRVCPGSSSAQLVPAGIPAGMPAGMQGMDSQNMMMIMGQLLSQFLGQHTPRPAPPLQVFGRQQHVHGQRSSIAGGAALEDMEGEAGGAAAAQGQSLLGGGAAPVHEHAPLDGGAPVAEPPRKMPKLSVVQASEKVRLAMAKAKDSL